MPVGRQEMSPDSSTHISEKSRRSKKRKHKQKSKASHKRHKSSSSESNRFPKKSKKHKKKSTKSSQHSGESEDEQIYDIKPLSGYVDDRKQLHHEIFTLLSKKEIKEMLPDTLKKLKFKEIKNLCLEQLEIMSQKRLRHVIAGQEMVSSSSDESTETNEMALKNVETKQKHDENNEHMSSMSAFDLETTANKEEATKAPVGKQPPYKISILEEMSVSPNQDEIDELIEGESKVSQNQLGSAQDDKSDQDVVKYPDALPEDELIELEFRARALKSLVMAREKQQLQAQKTARIIQ